MVYNIIKLRERKYGGNQHGERQRNPCLYYICMGECKKGRDANHWHYCQKCDKYIPRARVRHLNKKKEKLEKMRKNEKY